MPISRSFADSLSTITNVIGIASLGVGAVSAALIFWISNVKEEYFKRDLADAQKAVSEANEQAEGARKEAAKANEAAETLRQRNLELEQAVSPRLLEQGHFSQVLKLFAGTRVIIIAVPDFETRRFAQMMDVMFKMAQWDASLEILDSNLIMDGVSLEYVSGPLVRDFPELRFRDDLITGQEPFREFNQRAREAAGLVVKQLVENNRVEARDAGMPPLAAANVWDKSFPTDAILVKVGLKPATYFSNKRIKDLKDRTGNVVFDNR
jgi:hypothetical protein